MHKSDATDEAPGTRPRIAAPRLWSINGCGLAAYGRRDVDPETGTFVKTHCLILLFIPILALASYRVQRAEGGWHFLHRAPLSTLARAWNFAVVVVLVIGAGVAGYATYTGSAAYRTRTRLAEAAVHAARGEVAVAARLHGEVARDDASVAEQGWSALSDLLAQGLDTAPPEEVAGALEVAVDLLRSARTPRAIDVVSVAIAQSAARAADDPEGALRILGAVERAVGPEEDAAWHAARLAPLELLAERRPDDVDVLSSLAVAYEAGGEWERAHELLAPHAANLGTSEGARILGQALAGEDRLDEAHALLEPYVTNRLPGLRAVEKEWQRLEEAAWSKSIKALEEGDAPSTWYAAYERASQAEQEDMVSAWVQERMERDPAVARTRDRYVAEAGVVPAALDLGLLQVQRAGRMSDPDARQRELDAAEQTFLAIQSTAGDTDEYRLAMGQASYWMGRHEEGRALLDALLKENQRSPDSLMMVGETLRAVGAHDEAGGLFEEAYTAGRTTEDRYAAATLRALAASETADELKWLRRADPTSSFVRAGIATALADQAVDQGDKATAERHLRDAADTYAQMPESSSTRNNAALILVRLHRITGDPATLEQAADMAERGVALDPDNSIALHTASETLLKVAVGEVIGERIGLARLGLGPDLDLLDFLYLDRDGRDEIARQLGARPRFERAMAYAERSLLLAPRSAEIRQSIFTVKSLSRDMAAIGRLLEGARDVDLDDAGHLEGLASYIAGTDDAQHRATARARIDECRAVIASGASGATHAVALTGVFEASLSLQSMGDPVDPDELLALAEAAHEVAPSSQTRTMLLTALLLRANTHLEVNHASLAGLRRDGRRILAEALALILALEMDEGLRRAAAGHGDVARALGIVREQARAFPDDPAPWVWALLRFLDPEGAAAEAQRVRADGAGDIRRELSLLLWPGSAWTVYERAWERRIHGDDAEAAAILDRCRALGVPLP